MNLTLAIADENSFSQLSPEGQEWVQESCPKTLGPSLWISCINRQTSALLEGIPDLSGLSQEYKNWVLQSCPTSLGPSITIPCLKRQVDAILTNHENAQKNLQSLPDDQRAWVQGSCSKSLGPSIYFSCVERESKALLNNRGLAMPASSFTPASTPIRTNPGYDYYPVRSRGGSGGCGSRGGPGYRKANGKCASWSD